VTAPDSPRPEPDSLAPAGRPFSAMRALAWAIFLVAATGLAFHVVFYFAGPTEWLVAYARGLGMKIGAGIAFANLLASHLHYWRTRMRLDITSRVVTYLWILSIVLYMHLVLGGKPIWE
jgi:hypothetical protein